MPDPTSPAGFVSIADAAALIGVKPWDVVRLIESGRVKSIQLVEVSSLRTFAGGES